MFSKWPHQSEGLHHPQKANLGAIGTLEFTSQTQKGCHKPTRIPCQPMYVRPINPFRIAIYMLTSPPNQQQARHFNALIAQGTPRCFFRCLPWTSRLTTKTTTPLGHIVSSRTITDQPHLAPTRSQNPPPFMQRLALTQTDPAHI